ncbi:MAG: carboxyl-terminal processing protease [Myxococcota bacterium]|jgi:carboxyl-terminal processing protease
MKRMRTATASMLVAGLMGSGLMLGSATGSWAADRATDPYASLDTLAQAITIIESRYVDDVDPDDLVAAAIRGMTADLDPHTRWLTPEETRRLMSSTEGSYEGVGLETSLVAEGVRIERVFAGGPSERAGLVAGDIMVSADAVSLVGLSDPAVTELLHGPRGEPVDIGIVRSDSTDVQIIRVIRDRIITDPVESAALGDVAYVRLMHFQKGSGEAVTEALMGLRSEGATAGVILDLRDNPGGVLDEAVTIADLFLDDGPIVSTRGRSESEEIHSATPGGIPADVPVVVLINGMSASASEIVAGALQDTDRATLVGADSYGKGSVQVLFETRDGGALKLTTSLYYTPSGTPVAAEVGRLADIAVRMDDTLSALQTLRKAVEEQSDDDERTRLLELVDAIDADDLPREFIPWDVPPTQRLNQDRQLSAALAHLRASEAP